MFEIKTNQELKIENVLSFRGKIEQSELENIGRNMENKLNELGVKRKGNPVTATFGVEDGRFDVEILLPIDRYIGDADVGEYTFKEKIHIVNAAVVAYKGHPSRLQDACNELNQYIVENNLQPITVGYNVTKHEDKLDINNTEIYVYVGINPNVL